MGVVNKHQGHPVFPVDAKGLQLRLELGNVVTGEGEVERGESGSWRLDRFKCGRGNRPA
jgi:hypothetical protein